eukprot:8962067-Alexandrium_andersonii.AAC.1
MSASLVGSEMCIRDSQDTSTGPNGGTAGSSASGAVHLSSLGSLEQLRFCLLYTSDAADDM